jgi:hypothetical protein
MMVWIQMICPFICVHVIIVHISLSSSTRNSTVEGGKYRAEGEEKTSNDDMGGYSMANVAVHVTDAETI